MMTYRMNFFYMRSVRVINKLHHTRGLYFPYHLLCEPHQTKTCALRSEACQCVFIDFVSEECQLSFIYAQVKIGASIGNKLYMSTV